MGTVRAMAPPTLGSRRARRALDRLHERPVNFAVSERPTGDGDGWRVDDYCLPLPAEPPGPPVEGGSWRTAQRVIRDYEFADPRMIRTITYPDAPLEDRDMLLVGRFLGLRFHMGVRIGGVLDEQCETERGTARVWGWDYRTLEGHLEAGQMDYEVWKWLDTGEVEFHVRRFVRPATGGNPIVRLGFAVFGRMMQVLFVRRAFRRMLAFVHAERGEGPPPKRLAADAVRATARRP